MPDVCCTCGMYTPDRVRIKVVGFRKVAAVPGDRGQLYGLAKLALGLLLGPIGWLIVLGISEDDDESYVTKNVKEKAKLTVSQCILCQAQTKPEVVESNWEYGEYCLRVHPEFARRYRDSKL